MSPAPAADTPFIAADVGGTHARLALVRFTAQGAVSILHYSEYICAEYPDLATILRTFIETHGSSDTVSAAIAIAGLQDGDNLINPNLPWHVSLSQTRQAARLKDLALINDFEALAHAAPHIDLASAQLLSGQPVDPSKVTTLVVGPGTGFGQAVRIPHQPRPVVITSEAGHAALAPGNELEIDILRELFKRWPHVDRERAVSGPGLLNLYECICILHGVPALLRPPADVTSAALANANPQAVTALNVFCGLLGSLVGDLVLAYNARAVFLAGGIPSRIRSFLPTSKFVARYHNKGALGEVIKHVPIWLIEHGQLGLIGAAAWYQDHNA
ncbi:MAG: glucokinase [Rudaea sp.]|nr:glucokinase [Rudaea sp.]